MSVAWICPNPADGQRITDYRLLNKRTGAGRWFLLIRCGRCQGVIDVTKTGLRFVEPHRTFRAPSRDGAAPLSYVPEGYLGF